ncbi:DegT/DnrJ/EryC1/StrS family aminotransferase [Polynucleobacter tropicus]
MNEFIKFSSPEIGDDEIAGVVDVLRSGWLTSGARSAAFERDFAEFLGGSVEAIAVNSATAGLHLALEAVGVGAGDEVITTTHTFTATAEVIRYLGANPVFLDIDPSTLCIDISKIESAITPKTKAIIVVHFAGISANISAVAEIAKRYDIKIVEDAAHALPSSIDGHLVGTLNSDATVFSFYANKTITTGEGGMLVTRSQEIANRARLMRLHGIDRDAFGRFQAKIPSWFYQVMAPGYKYNLTDMAAAIGIAQLKKAWRFQAARERIAKEYNQKLNRFGITIPPQPLQGDVHSWHLYVIQLPAEMKEYRDNFINKMHDYGVGCSVHYIPLHLQPYWKSFCDLRKEMFPVSQMVYETSVSLPIYSSMSDEQINRVIQAVELSLP